MSGNIIIHTFPFYTNLVDVLARNLLRELKRENRFKRTAELKMSSYYS